MEGNAFIDGAVEKYADTVFRVAWQYVRNRQDAEDILQNVFLKFVDHARRGKFGSEEHAKAWLIRVTVNESKNLAKFNSRRAPFDEAFQSSESGFEDLESLLDGLTATDREAVYLYYYEGYSAKEVARLIGKSEKAVFKRLSRAREKLKTYLKEDI